MRMVLVIVASLGLPVTAVAAEAAADRRNKVVCKGDRTRSLGSNMTAKKVCRTRAEWAEISAGTRRELQGLSERALNPTPIPGAR